MGDHTMKRFHLLVLGALVLTASPAFTQAPALPQPGSVFLEELTWVEVRDAIAAGKTTVIIPTGGTEQNGPHMALGKHNYLVKYKAGESPSGLATRLSPPSSRTFRRPRSTRRRGTCGLPARSHCRKTCSARF